MNNLFDTLVTLAVYVVCVLVFIGYTISRLMR